MGKGKRLGKERYRTLEVVTQPVGKKQKKIIMTISVILFTPNIYSASIKYQRNRTLSEIILILALSSIFHFFITANILDGKINVRGVEIERSKEPFRFWFQQSFLIIAYIFGFWIFPVIIN